MAKHSKNVIGKSLNAFCIPIACIFFSVCLLTTISVAAAKAAVDVAATMYALQFLLGFELLVFLFVRFGNVYLHFCVIFSSFFVSCYLFGPAERVRA